MAFELMNEFVSSVQDAQTSAPPKFQGRVLAAIISKKKVASSYEKNQTENKKISTKKV